MGVQSLRCRQESLVCAVSGSPARALTRVCMHRKDPAGLLPDIPTYLPPVRAPQNNMVVGQFAPNPSDSGADLQQQQRLRVSPCVKC